MLSTLIGSASHLVFGGNGQRLLVFVLAAWIGFFIGNGVGEVMGIHVLAIGTVNVFTAILGAIIASVAAAVFTGRVHNATP